MRYLQNLEFRKRIPRILTGFLIFSPIIPVVILDVWVELYHRICFPIYEIKCVERKKYIKIDRHKLAYLHLLQKIYCIYCGYVNGVFAYWVEIGAQTERFWCGIQHKGKDNFVEPAHHQEFTPYGDKQAFESKYKKKS